jgi:glutathione reductase (NADPH)
VGDVTDRVALTPVAIREGHAFADTVFGGKDIKVDHELIATAVFSQPEIGTVGLTEATGARQVQGSRHLQVGVPPHAPYPVWP